mgnify:FL=1
MTAIYKRELKSYLTSMVGYLFIFFILVLTGIYFSAYQLSAAYPKFEYTLSAITFAFLIGVPILTMRVLAEERKQKTDQLLLTAPVSVSGIVIGKYLALVTVFAVPMAVMCTYPLIMSRFGTVEFASAYTAVLGFFLLGCANIAIGVFMSALTESQVIAAVLTFVFLFAFYMMNGISSFFSQTSMSTCVTFGLLILAAAIIIYTMIKNILISAVIGLIAYQVLLMSSETVKFALNFTDVPVATGILIAIVGAYITFLSKTKLGSDINAVGQNRNIAISMGIPADKIRITAIMISTLLAALGQLVFIQDIGNFTTYTAHENVGTFSIAALLVGGASIKKANIGHAILGALLFHTMFIISPLAGKNLFNNAQLGEYFRVFVCYAVIAVALALHAWKTTMAKKAEEENTEEEKE